MKKISYYILITAFIVTIVAACKKDKGEAAPVVVECTTTISYSVSIVPIVTTKCATASSCHKAGSVNGDYTTYAGLKAKVDNGSLNNRVVVTKTMPSTGPLSDADISTINCWIKQGGLNN